MERPNLELPTRVAVSRPIFDRRSTFFFICGLLAVAALAAIEWTRARGPGAAPVSIAGSALTPDALEKLALRLEDKNLSAAAADAWRDYLRVATPDTAQTARIEARIGRLLESAGRFEDAIACYYRAEALDATSSGDAGDLSLRIRDCFQRMGRMAELAREVQQRTALDKASGDLSGQQVVAEIGDQKISVAEFEQMLREEIDSSLSGRDAAEGEELRRKAWEQLASPQARARALQQIVGRRVLIEEARRRKLDQEPSYRRQLTEQADSLLARELSEREIGARSTVTPEDVRRYFEANRTRYVIPAQGDIAQIVCETREAAEEIIKKLDGGADFAALAREKSTDAATRDNGGRVPGSIRPGSDEVPGAGTNRTLREELWSLSPGKHRREPFKGAHGWYVYQLVSKREESMPKYETIEREVRDECRAARQREVAQQFMKELFEQYKVNLNPAALPTSQPAVPKSGAS